jgi:hypothetical protein
MDALGLTPFEIALYITGHVVGFLQALSFCWRQREKEREAENAWNDKPAPPPPAPPKGRRPPPTNDVFS